MAAPSPPFAPDFPATRSRLLWPLAAVALIAGTAARVLFPGLTAFGLDEGIASILTVQLVHKGQIPLVGVKTGLFFYNPPLLPWALAPAFALSRSPVTATEWVSLWNITSVLGMGWCAWRLSGRDSAVATIAVIVAALSPTWVEHSRRLWGHALMLPATTAALCFAIRWFFDGRLWALTGLMASVAAAQALHFSGALLWIVFGLLWISTPRGRRPRIGAGPLITGIAVALLWYGPYFVHLVRTDFQDVRIMADAVQGKARAEGSPIGSPWTAFALLLGDAGHSDVMGIDPASWPALYRATLPPLRILSVSLLLSGLLYAVYRILRGRWTLLLTEDKRATADNPLPLALWGVVLAVVPPVAFWLVQASFVPAYLLPGAPGAVLLAAGLAAGARRGELFARTGLIAAMSAWSIVTVVNWAAVMTTLATATPESQTFTTLRHQDEAAAWIARHADEQPVVVTQGERKLETGIDYSYLYLLWAETDDPERFRRLDDWQQLFVIVDSKDRLHPDVLAALEGADTRREEFGTLRVYGVDRATSKPLLQAIDRFHDENP